MYSGIPAHSTQHTAHSTQQRRAQNAQHTHVPLVHTDGRTWTCSGVQQPVQQQGKYLGVEDEGEPHEHLLVVLREDELAEHWYAHVLEAHDRQVAQHHVQVVVLPADLCAMLEVQRRQVDFVEFLKANAAVHDLLDEELVALVCALDLRKIHLQVRVDGHLPTKQTPIHSVTIVFAPIHETRIQYGCTRMHDL
jgi:hypothetical protein